MEIVVDTTPPPVTFGTAANPNDGLLPGSDTGVSPPNPDTIIDLITNDTTPTLWGMAEADAIVRVYVDVNNNGVLDLGIDPLLGQATAIPLDGTNAEPNGFWELHSLIDLNDPTYFPVPDGLRTIFVTAQDLAGNVNQAGGAADILQIFVRHARSASHQRASQQRHEQSLQPVRPEAGQRRPGSDPAGELYW